jgi:hypothetical protein
MLKHLSLGSEELYPGKLALKWHSVAEVYLLAPTFKWQWHLQKMWRNPCLNCAFQDYWLHLFVERWEGKWDWGKRGPEMWKISKSPGKGENNLIPSRSTGLGPQHDSKLTGTVDGWQLWSGGLLSEGHGSEQYQDIRYWYQVILNL